MDENSKWNFPWCFLACRPEWGSCLSYHFCGLTCVFQFGCWHIHYNQKGKCWLWTARLFESDLTMACFLSKYTLWKCYYACYKVYELHFLTTIAIRLTRAAGKCNQQVQSTTDGSKINFLLNSPLLTTMGNIQHLRYLSKTPPNVAKKICSNWHSLHNSSCCGKWKRNHNICSRQTITFEFSWFSQETRGKEVIGKKVGIDIHSPHIFFF